MEYIIVALVAMLVAALTLFSGFGLGTLLMPVMAIFFPVEIAIAATAIVHLANNIFKGVLVGRNADLKVLFIFALPAVLAAFPGALLLRALSGMNPWVSWYAGAHTFNITPVNLIVAILMVIFAVIELLPYFEKMTIGRRWLPLGGVLSGFFGGISGHQGALRSAFLSKSGLSREGFIGTSVMTAIMVDISRIVVYGTAFFSNETAMLDEPGMKGVLICGILAAFTGSYTGTRLVKKVTMRHIQLIVGVMLLLLAVALGSGII
ncbi:MAG: sulfite exporter TauE/SafE family protein [Bacteroidetes bacterium]|nr:sulfite exporter TauE/SafE family protein [Bacteroidota bacterium]